MRSVNTIIATALMVPARRRGCAMICGWWERTRAWSASTTSLGAADAKQYTALNAVLTPTLGALFIADTYVNEDPTAEELADIAWAAVRELQRFGLPPGGVPVASSFGSSKRNSARGAAPLFDLFGAPPDIECDGELHGDAALEPGSAHQLSAGLHAHRRGQPADHCPNFDSANIPLQRAQDHDQRRDRGPHPHGHRRHGHILTPHHRAPRAEHDSPGCGGGAALTRRQ